MNQATAQTGGSTYTTMAKALHILATCRDAPPSLAQLANACGLSEFHFQKQFCRWVGISPKRFSQYLSKEYIKQLLDAGMQPLDACYQAGLSGPGRMHELFIRTEAMTPAEYRRKGKGLIIRYAIFESPFGPYLLAVTDKGICHLEFITADEQAIRDNFHDNWPLSVISRDEKSTAPVHRLLFGKPATQPAGISLLLKGTNFQIQVWQALLRIPYGQVASYEEIAGLAGNPAATRASASAIARNRIAWLIPCHRVVRKLGETGQYRWGSEKKKIILGYEAATAGR
jgi:AraC family transcriptional regulator of adaptative response/methylated-DNA-[protein]-cysteine methyltransferase